ncbi:MAG TPA: ABC transporter permease [Candidatus Limnocylindrales bacterium]|jgi:ABC-type multidrug transport system, permease component|nr:ABC transporter permease [Candidatus Limnocylindrales bacterium]
MKTIRDTWLIYQRSLTLSLRNPIWVAFGIIQPVLYLLLFGPLLNNIAKMPGFPPGGAFNVFVPGMLVMTALFSSGYVGFGLIDEMREGVVERMRVTPMSRVAMLVGRSLRDVTLLLAQAAVLVLLAIPFGLEINPGGVAVAFGLLALIGLMMSPVSYILALTLKSEDALAPVVNGVTVPLLLLSGVMLPMSFAPDWLQTVARFNPLYHAVAAIRALFNASYGDSEIVFGVALLAILAMATISLGARTFSRAAS